MSKYGITTHYYNSLNYGGILQAYALCRVLGSMDVQAEQLCFPFCGKSSFREKNKKELLKKLLSPSFMARKLASAVVHNPIVRRRVEKKLQGRRKAFTQFCQQYIPHSQAVYTNKNLHTCNGEYDGFITGSDQVWNPSWYNPNMFLSFVQAGKPKIAYAASIGQQALTDAQKQLFRTHLADFDAISVREADALAMISPLTDVAVTHTVDPTLLLSQADWNEVCAERLVNEPYVFCYFLGAAANQRRIASQFARRHGLTLVTIPHATGDHVRGDRMAGARLMWDASPADFLSLIRHAQYVFTDSFHACVFSCVYQKQFFAFPRHGCKGMSSRLWTLLELYGCRDRLLDGKTEQPEALPPIDYTQPLDRFEGVKAESLSFLQEHLRVGR